MLSHYLQQEPKWIKNDIRLIEFGSKWPWRRSRVCIRISVYVFALVYVCLYMCACAFGGNSVDWLLYSHCPASIWFWHRPSRACSAQIADIEPHDCDVCPYYSRQVHPNYCPRRLPYRRHPRRPVRPGRAGRPGPKCRHSIRHGIERPVVQL